MKQPLRPHQQQIVDTILPLIGVREKLLIAMPEGAGKEFTLVRLLSEYLELHQRMGTHPRVLLLVYQVEKLHRMRNMIYETLPYLKLIVDHVEEFTADISLFLTTVQSLTRQDKYKYLSRDAFDLVVFLDCENSGIGRPDSRPREVARYFKAKTYLALESEFHKSSLYFGPPAFVYTVQDAIRDNIFVRGFIQRPEAFLEVDENRKLVDKMVKPIEGSESFSPEEFEPLIRSILENTRNEKTAVICVDRRAGIIADFITRIQGKENYAIEIENHGYSIAMGQEKLRDDTDVVCFSLDALDRIDLRIVTQVVLLCDLSSEDKCRRLLEKCMLSYPEKHPFILWDYSDAIAPYFGSLQDYYLQNRESPYGNPDILLDQQRESSKNRGSYGIVEGDIFECKCEVLVIPVAWVGPLSSSFIKGIENIQKYTEKKILPEDNYEPGEISVCPVDGHPYLKYIVFACTVGKMNSSYGTIRKIGHALGQFVRNTGINTMATTLLGTGSGELNPVISYEILLTSFLEMRPGNCRFTVYVFDMKAWQQGQKQMPVTGNYSDPKTLLQLDLSFVLKTTYIQNILHSNEFYYQLASDKFKEFQDYRASSNFYRKLNSRFKNSNQSYIQFLSGFKRDSEEFRFLQLCGELVAYIDYRAYLKNVWNEYSDKRVIAYSNVYQKNWIQNLLLYKQSGNNPNTIRANSIHNALLYFHDPGNHLTMLSESHREMVVETFLGGSYQADTACQEIFSLFKEKNISCKNPLNNGALYTILLYSSVIKPLWLQDKSNTEKLGKITRELKNEREAKGVELATKLIHENLLSRNAELYLGGCGFSDFSEIPELTECVHLKKLVLSNEWGVYNEESSSWELMMGLNTIGRNYLNSLPEQLASLVNLETLICGGDWDNSDGEISYLPSWTISDISVLSKLTNLRYLNLSNNAIDSIKPLRKLKSLRVLHLNNNHIKDITPLKDLYGLEELYLSNNQIEDVKPLTKIENLQTLDLHANQIRDLSPLEHLIEKIDATNTKWNKGVINVARNPLEKPPVQIIENGKRSILQYFKDLQPENYVNREIKVILVGNSEVGKTTLAKYLNNKKDLDITHSATHWMQEIEVTCKYNVKDLPGGCQLHLFDFGGHDYFHDTHHMFYSANTLYILLWDKASNRLHLRDTWQKDHSGKEISVQTQDYPIEYWLESVQFYVKDKEADNFAFELPRSSSYNSYLLVIQNKVQERTKDVHHLNNSELFRKYPFIYEFMHMSIIDKEHNMDYFDAVFEEMLNKMPIVGAVLPPYYGKVKEHISTSYDGDPIISMEAFHRYCNEEVLLSPEEKITPEQSSGLAGYLRQIGVILLNDRNREKVYIGKKWIIENIYNVLKGVKDNRGEFDFEHVKEQIDSHSIEDAGDILSIMEDFKMIFRHPYQHDSKPVRYIAPLYLPLMPDDVVGLFLDKDPIPYRRLEYAGFIHKQVILNFFHDYGHHIWGEKGETDSYYYYWKDGLILKDPNTGNMVMILFHIAEKKTGKACVDIFEVRSKSNDNTFINNIVTYLKEMNKEYRIEEMVTLDGNDFVSLELLKENARNGKLIFTRQRREERDNDQEEKKYYKLKDYKQFFMDEGIKRKKVVVSYSKKDLAHLHLLKRYLRPLVDMELIEEPWNCTHNLTASQEWNSEIQQHFESADVVIFLVSENFYATRYIVEHEIPNAIDRYDRDKSVKIVPIILEFYDWGRKDPHNLKRFTALPYQAKPISDFNNPKMAWYTIAESIRMMLEKDLDPGNLSEMSREIQDIYERLVSGKLDRNSL